jgi:hypothetical protein
MKLKETFASFEVPFSKVIRNRGERYSLLNYNFLFRRAFDLLGYPHYGSDFPPLKSKKKRD